MSIVTVEQEFALGADKLWQLLGDFGDTGRWSGRPKDACVQRGHGVGALRTLKISDGREVVDRLEAVTENSYSYSIVTSDLPYKSYRATMSVVPISGGGSKFTWQGEFEALGMSTDECVQFTKSVYAMGIGMMKKTLGINSTA